MFFNAYETEQSLQGIPQLQQPQKSPLEEAAVGFAEGYIAAKILKVIFPMPKPWRGQ